jgi:hypothetical protein
MELLKDKVASLYVEYKEFEKVVKAKNEALYKDKSSLKEVVEGKTVEELQQVLVHTYVDTILYNKDLQILFFKLIVSIETYLEVVGQGLQEDIQTFYSEMKNWAPKRVFVIEKGELVETEPGTLEEERAKFLESDFFKQMLEKTKDN